MPGVWEGWRSSFGVNGAYPLRVTAIDCFPALGLALDVVDSCPHFFIMKWIAVPHLWEGLCNEAICTWPLALSFVFKLFFFADIEGCPTVDQGCPPGVLVSMK